MLSADIAVVRSFCFFLSKRQNLLGALSKSLKRIQGPYPSWTTSSTTRWGQHLLNASAVPGGTSAPNIASNSATGFQLRGGAVKHLLERIGGFVPSLVALTLPLVSLPIASDSYILPRASIVIAGACLGIGLALLISAGPSLGAWRLPLLAAAGAAMLAFVFSISWPLSLIGSFTRYESLPMSLSYLGLAASAAFILVWPPLRGLNQDPPELRVHLYQDALRMIAARPVSGWGEDTTGLAFGQFLSRDYAGLVTFDRVHSGVLEIAATQGLLGLAALTWVIVVLARGMRCGRSRPGAPGLAGALVGYSVWVFFNFDWAPATGAFWLLAGTCWSVLQAPPRVAVASREGTPVLQAPPLMAGASREGMPVLQAPPRVAVASREGMPVLQAPPRVAVASREGMPVLQAPPRVAGRAREGHPSPPPLAGALAVPAVI